MLTDESKKFVNFYQLSEFLQAEGLPQAKHQHRSSKKVTDMKRVAFDDVTGLLLADKMGEIGFINI